MGRERARDGVRVKAREILIRGKVALVRNTTTQDKFSRLCPFEIEVKRVKISHSKVCEGFCN